MPAKKHVLKKKAKPTKKTKKAPKKKAAKRRAVKAVKVKAAKTPKRRARKPAKKTAATAPAPVLPWREPLPGETKIGLVEDYYSHINVIVLTLEQPLAVGDKIHVRGHTTDLLQAVESIQIARQSVPRAEAQAAAGVKVDGKCRKGDYVYRVAA